MTGLNDCQAALQTAVQALSRRTDSEASHPGLGDVFAQLLSNLRQTVTSLSLAFKPPVTIPAAIQQLDKVSDQVGRLISCVLLAPGELATEWRQGMSNIGVEMVKYLQVLVSDGDYLGATGMVWEAIDSLANDLSKDEPAAVAKRWRHQQSVVKDAWDEFKGILEGGDDDGWDELDMGESLTEKERTRTEAVLHAMFPRYLDQCKSKYRAVLETSSSFVDSFDKAVSAMHPEQDEEEVNEALKELEAVSRRLAETVHDTAIDRWRDRLDLEKKKWEERRLDLTSLSVAIE
ncbi:hypothetical protein IAR55_004999 [Kwoniella newhampshirensis]|uniref:Cyclin-D1-binding protein 1-like N-terminal domain-containing protein n=1 Tax=Kwoniella newhampshirensis TaxID=1651941 RepID=A0AAW0YNH7_9TREE